MEDEYGLKSIVSFLNDEKFVEKNLNSMVGVFGYEIQIIKLLIANLTGLHKHNDDLFKKRCQELNFNLIEVIFNIINKAKSDVTFSAYLFLSKFYGDNLIENEFNKTLIKYENYLKRCVEDFNSKEPKLIERTRREITIDKKVVSKKFYKLDLDQCGIPTSLDLILTTLRSYSLGEKREKFRTLIEKSHKSYLDVILEKGETYEQRLVLDLYIELSFYEHREMKLSNEIQKAIKANKEYSKVLEDRLILFGYITRVEYETKGFRNDRSVKHKNHDFVDVSRHQNEFYNVEIARNNMNENVTNTYILITFDSDNEKKCNDLSQRLAKLGFNALINNMEGIFHYY